MVKESADSILFFNSLVAFLSDLSSSSNKQKECFLLVSYPGADQLFGLIYPGNNSCATGSLDHIPSISPDFCRSTAQTYAAAVSRKGGVSLFLPTLTQPPSSSH